MAFQPAEFKPTEHEDGFFATLNPFEKSQLDVNFYFPGVRRKLEVAIHIVIENIKTADKNSLAALSAVNRKLLAFRVVGSDEDCSTSTEPSSGQ